MKRILSFAANINLRKLHCLYCLWLTLFFTSAQSICLAMGSSVLLFGGDTVRQYQNPVFEPILADPTVVRDARTGLFYAYGTQDDWGDGHGSRLMPILQSADLIHWEYVGNVFNKKPDWKKGGGLWAPDINFVDGQYYLYYSFSLWGDPNPGIGLAIAAKPEGPFIDQGKLFSSEDINVPNSIDPSLYQEDDTNYLIWGSFGNGPNQGIHVIPLDKEGKRLANKAKKVKLAAGDWEAAMLHKRNGYYYFFGSKGSCCEGANSQYRVLVARSKKPLGPYLDQAGKAITERGNGTLLLKGSNSFAGPGHHAKIITDDEGTDWLLYHGIRKDNPKVRTGATRRALMLDNIVWESGWPKIKDGVPSTEERTGPIFKN
ncbi:family 43 glycosylhydrolase [Sphingobacterium deserti]|uniref:Glycoside hydrolase family 43 n=1 Tax=Sphingobacterium deserti TaxID=1229276 RepID=A0A0B8T8T8_9SPHI|nr:family 43 glycosylhydrolase [Sphingobacterium deserti]KGE15084.1 glycoside hydrolase family 43 [Sphingobacterium deserti]